MGARILFLDDMNERHEAFQKTVGVPVDHVFTAAWAIKMLKEEKYDQVFLDHDLSIDDILVAPGEPTKEPTGMDVVDHILTMEEPPAEVVVHSANPAAADRMGQKLREHPAGIRVLVQAFPTLIASLRRR